MTEALPLTTWARHHEGLAVLVADDVPVVVPLEDQRTPVGDLLDVLAGHKPRALVRRETCPLDEHPRQAADASLTLADRLPASRLAVIGAIGTPVEHVHPAVAHGHQRIHVEHVAAVVERPGVIRAVHVHGLRVVVDRDVHGPAQSLLDPCARPSAPAEQIHHQSLVNRPHVTVIRSANHETIPQWRMLLGPSTCLLGPFNHRTARAEQCGGSYRGVAAMRLSQEAGVGTRRRVEGFPACHPNDRRSQTNPPRAGMRGAFTGPAPTVGPKAPASSRVSTSNSSPTPVEPLSCSLAQLLAAATVSA